MNFIFKISITIFFVILFAGFIYSGKQYVKEVENKSESKATSPDYREWLYVKKGTLKKDNNCVKFIETISNEEITMCGTYSIKGF